MSVRAGREFLAIPGPTTMPDEVLQAMHRPAIDIYAGSLLALTERLHADLHWLFKTRGHTYIYIANGHGAWEAALTNVLSRGDRILVLESGRFATSWGDMAAKLGIEVEVLRGEWHRAIRPAEVERRLRRDAKEAGKTAGGRRFKAVLAVQIDTASGVVNDIAAIGKAIRAAGHDALYMVDAVASLACMPFEMDAWGVDVAMSGSQKGLMTPPGMSFVAAGKRARAAHKRADLRTPYWDWTSRESEVHYMKYAGTPPEQLMFGLARAFEMIRAEGLDAIFRRHRLLAEATRRAVAVWARGKGLAFNITAPAERSDTVTTIRMVDGGDARPLLAYCNVKCGVVLGQGLGDMRHKAFRIAHMGHVNAPMVLGTLGVVECALEALRIPHRKGGLQAAIAWLGREVK
jgi:alanine-glyoxylate transaminase/serine-glyoxylate transaminase/serine-pyruvate transaminase